MVSNNRKRFIRKVGYKVKQGDRSDDDEYWVREQQYVHQYQQYHHHHHHPPPRRRRGQTRHEPERLEAKGEPKHHHDHKEASMQYPGGPIPAPVRQPTTQQTSITDDSNGNVLRKRSIRNIESASLLNDLLLPSPWNDMDLRKEVARCGVDKCFFRSLSDASIGYLVAGSSQWPTMMEAYDLAHQLEQDFRARHLNTHGPPRLVPVVSTSTMRAAARGGLVGQRWDRIADEETWTDFLNRLVVQPGREAQGAPTMDVYGTNVDSGDTNHLVVQIVSKAPEPHLFVGLGNNNYHYTAKQMREADSFRRHITGNEASFRERFGREIERVAAILHRYPVLFNDFQGMVDVHGNLYVMDLDLDPKWKDEVPAHVGAFIKQQLRHLESIRTRLTSESHQSSYR